MPKSLTVVASSDQPWYADGLSFGCTQCGNCCTGGPGYVWMSDREVDLLADYLKMSREETLKKYCRKLHGRISLKETRDAKGEYPCIFLKEDPQGRRTCTVYPVRPLQCRTWPFWDGNLELPGSWKLAARKCPGINKGRAYTLQQIAALRDATEWPEIARTPSSDATITD